MRLSVVGTGHVGLVAGACLADMGNQVICVDNDRAKICTLNSGIPPFFEPGLQEMVQANTLQHRLCFTSDISQAIQNSDVIFIAVDTPSLPDGSADLSSLMAVSDQIATNLNGYKVVVQKSTVPVGTGDRLLKCLRDNANGVAVDLVSMPEFLREGSALRDFLHPDRIVIGTDSSRAREIMQDLLGPLNAPMVFPDIPTAELIKYASNAFLAMKVSYINAVANICELAGADVTMVARGMGYDPRIGSRFLAAGVGYGGACFQKDVSAFIKMSQAMGYDFNLLKDVQDINHNQRVQLVDKVRRELGTLKGTHIAVLGLAYKPDTDDMRNAPSIDVIDLLLRDGATVSAYDPAATETARCIFGDTVDLCSSPQQAAKGADALLVLTEWDEFSDLDLQEMKKLMARPVLVDGRNLFNPQAMADMGWHYLGTGKRGRSPEVRSLQPTLSAR